MTDTVFRRWFGLILGGALGLTYGLVSQWLNRVILPGIPLYQPPFGPVWNTILSTAVGLLLGLIAAWPERWYLGALISAAVGTALVQVAILLTAPKATQALPATVCIFMPIAAMIIPLVVLIRWQADRQLIARADRLPAWRRALAPLLLILIAGGLGALWLYRAAAREPLVEMNAVVQAAERATDRAALPAPYQSIDAAGYPERLRGRYTLDWEVDNLSRFAIPRPLESEWDQVAVLARFEGGYAFACIFLPGREIVGCRGYEQWPVPIEE